MSVSSTTQSLSGDSPDPKPQQQQPEIYINGKISSKEQARIFKQVERILATANEPLDLQNKTIEILGVKNIPFFLTVNNYTTPSSTFQQNLSNSNNATPSSTQENLRNNNNANSTFQKSAVSPEISIHQDFLQQQSTLQPASKVSPCISSVSSSLSKRSLISEELPTYSHHTYDYLDELPSTSRKASLIHSTRDDLPTTSSAVQQRAVSPGMSACQDLMQQKINIAANLTLPCINTTIPIENMSLSNGIEDTLSTGVPSSAAAAPQSAEQYDDEENNESSETDDDTPTTSHQAKTTCNQNNKKEPTPLATNLKKNISSELNNNAEWSIKLFEISKSFKSNIELLKNLEDILKKDFRLMDEVVARIKDQSKEQQN